MTSSAVSQDEPKLPFSTEVPTEESLYGKEVAVPAWVPGYLQKKHQHDVPVRARSNGSVTTLIFTVASAQQSGTVVGLFPNRSMVHSTRENPAPDNRTTLCVLVKSSDLVNEPK